METTVFNVVVVTYLVIGLSKFLLCAPNLPTAIGVMSRLYGYERGKVKMRYVIAMPLTLAAVSLLGWVPALFRERWHFFFVASRFTIIREVVRAHREVNSV